MAPRVMPFFRGAKIAQNSVKTSPPGKRALPVAPYRGPFFFAKIAAREPFLGLLGPRGQTNFRGCGLVCFGAYRMWSKQWARKKKIALEVCFH